MTIEIDPIYLYRRSSSFGIFGNNLMTFSGNILYTQQKDYIFHLSTHEFKNVIFIVGTYVQTIILFCHSSQVIM
jgi:hypothetical protein